MSYTTTDVFSNPVSYRRCTFEDIPKHFRYVRRVVDKEESEAYKERMALSIEQGSAWCVEKTGVFLYLLLEDNIVAKIVSVSVLRPVEWLALMVSLMQRDELKELVFLKFTTHSNSEIKQITTLLSPHTLKGKLGTHKNLVVDIQRLRKLFAFSGAT